VLYFIHHAVRILQKEIERYGWSSASAVICCHHRICDICLEASLF